MGLTSSSPRQDISSIEDSLEDSIEAEGVNLLNDETPNVNICLHLLRRFLSFFNCDKTVRKRKRSENEENNLANEPKLLKLDVSTDTEAPQIINDETQTDVLNKLNDETQTEDLCIQLLSVETQTEEFEKSNRHINNSPNDQKQVFNDSLENEQKQVINDSPNLQRQVINDIVNQLKPVTNDYPESYLDFPFLTDVASIRDMNNSFTMLIMRGLAGSGKSTLVNKIGSFFPEAEVCSADHFFIQNDGKYVFDFSRLRDAHQYSQHRAEELCRCLTKVIIIDNTNVKRWEMGPYFKTAVKYRYSVVLVEPNTPWKFDVDELSVRNSHGVSREILQKKVKEWQIVSPQYFGWFLNLSDTSLLLEQGHAWVECCLNSQVLKFNEINSIKDYSRNFMSGSSRDRCHCTAIFMSKEMRAAGNLPTHLVDNLGKFSTLTITGFNITCQTLGARVVLTDEQIDLWRGNDIEVAIEKNESNSTNCKEPVVQIDQDWENLKETAETFCRSSLVRVSRQEMDVDCDRKVKGRRAHITLGTVGCVKPVQTGLDQLALLNNSDTEVLAHMSGGKLLKCGEMGWRIELDKWIRVRAVFTGLY